MNSTHKNSIVLWKTNMNKIALLTNSSNYMYIVNKIIKLMTPEFTLYQFVFLNTHITL
jgi:hypothetical protein